ncbi:MAG: hypothetical protein RBG13Loki_0171 [Promethearchaeota archaeon CR_4]|nr:MAG: hypothetical protein RBG13Loki_0171 [Candidatus Lokiarchaeota archaeon CR_4]
MGNVQNILKNRTVKRERLEREVPNLFEGFNELAKAYYKPGALGRKYKELLAVACAIATRCVPCLANHATNAIVAKVTREEVI